MDLGAIISLFSLVTGLYREARSNDELATKVEKIGSAALPVATEWIRRLFPSVPQSQHPAVAGVVLDMALVKEIQEVVGVDVDGYYGEKTKAAVKAWQSAHALDADGWAGIKTITAMGLRG